jgi:hypothetical protein
MSILEVVEFLRLDHRIRRSFADCTGFKHHCARPVGRAIGWKPEAFGGRRIGGSVEGNTDVSISHLHQNVLRVRSQRPIKERHRRRTHRALLVGRAILGDGLRRGIDDACVRHGLDRERGGVYRSVRPACADKLGYAGSFLVPKERLHPGLKQMTVGCRRGGAVKSNHHVSRLHVDQDVLRLRGGPASRRTTLEEY